MTAPQTATEKLACMEAKFEALGLRDYAAMARSIDLGGRKKGDGQHNERLADHWEQMADYVESLKAANPKWSDAKADAAMIAEFMTRPNFIAFRGDKESGLWDFWDLKGRPEVKAILRTRGRIN